MRGRAAVFSSRSTHWCSPPAVVDRVRALRGAIGLDPCSNPQSIVRAHVEWWRGGLGRSWNGYGLVYCNPPYGDGVGDWTSRCVKAADRGEDAVGLLPVRSDLLWWHRDVARAAAVCYWRGRVHFLGARTGAPFPSAIVFWGSPQLARAAREHFSDVGLVR